jgi:hypothetical protein
MLLTGTFKGVAFKDSDVANWDDFQPRTSKNDLGCNKPFLIYGIGGTLAVVFAEHAQEAYDTAADKGKLASCRVNESDPEYDADKGTYNGTEVDYLGNNGVPHDLTDVRIEEMDLPLMSLVGLFVAGRAAELKAVFDKHKADYYFELIRIHYNSPPVLTAAQCEDWLVKDRATNEKFPGLLADVKRVMKDE